MDAVPRWALWQTLRGPLTAGERNTTVSEQGGFAGPAPSGGMTENLNMLVGPPSTGPAPLRDMASILRGPAQHFQLDLDQAPQTIAAFRQAADRLRDLVDRAAQLANIAAPGRDGVSINAVKEIGQWAAGHDPGSLRSALESGVIELEKVTDALEQSVHAYRDTDEANAAQLRQQEL